MADFATTGDVAARWRPLTTAETTVAAALIADASAVLRARVSGLDARLTAGTLDDTLVTSVCVAMVLRVLRNPDGLVSEGIGEYTYRRDDTSGSLRVTAEELDLLTNSAFAPSAFTVYPGYTAGWTVTDGWT